jgi:hypothetical protein
MSCGLDSSTRERTHACTYDRTPYDDRFPFGNDKRDDNLLIPFGVGLRHAGEQPMFVHRKAGNQAEFVILEENPSSPRRQACGHVGVQALQVSDYIIIRAQRTTKAKVPKGRLNTAVGEVSE